jgi:hypothetical protein
MAKRIPAILRTAEEGVGEEAAKQLKAIARAIEADGPMVLDLSGWPFAGWEDMPARVNGKRPRQASFFDFEYWMYFRILQSVKFAETRLDPFRAIKHRELDKHLQWAETALGETKSFEAALKLSLAANAHDLSQLGKPESAHEFGSSLLNIDAGEINHLNIVADNFGAEFMGDLVLAIVAAELGIEVVIHVKQLPLFVSDATSDDVTILLDRLTQAATFGQRLLKAVRQGHIRFASNAIWSAPRFFDRLPPEELGVGARVLTILKGDLNFRRALGDVSVDIGTPFDQLPILPAAPMLSLRTIKSYCVAGITDWPEGVSRTDFPMDGSIVAVQKIPTRAVAAVEAMSSIPPRVARFRQWLRRGSAEQS